MTVMPSSSDVADKAVSTEDASGRVEVARLEAYLAGLIESKERAMKADASSEARAHVARRAGSAPSSPRRARITSSSTVSSSQNHHHHHHHHHRHHHHHHQHHHHEHQQPQDKKAHTHRRHGSAPCPDYIEDPTTHQHKQRHGRGKQKAIESPRSPKKQRRLSKSPNARDEYFGLNPKLTHLSIDADQDLALINLERTREALSDGIDYPTLNQSACYISNSAAQLKCEEEELGGGWEVDVEDEEPLSVPADGSHSSFHKPRKKRKRRRRKTLHSVEAVEELEVDPDELPPQARWTIVVVAGILLFLSLFLVSITLRMAPMIDEMVRKENEELLNSLNRDSSRPINASTLPAPA